MDDHNGPSPARRKVRFAPKAPQPSRKPKLTAPKSETGDEDGEAAQAQYLLGRFKENQTRQRPKVEKKHSVQVAFGPGAPKSTLLRTYGAQRGETSKRGKTSDKGNESMQMSPDGKNEQIIPSDKSHDLRQTSLENNNGQNIRSLPSVFKEDTAEICSSDAIEASAPKIKREYIEPWDYQHTYYPITLPMRRPYSGDPELLDQAEFGEAAKKEYDENIINPASDLGLLDENKKEKMFFFQLPIDLPVLKQSTSRKGKEKVENSISSKNFGALEKSCQLEEFPAGYMGKMLVYKSGAVKLKLGNTLFDVSPGSDCIFAQDVAAINPAEKQCCVIGELGKKVVVTPDISSVLDSVIDLS